MKFLFSATSPINSSLFIENINLICYNKNCAATNIIPKCSCFQVFGGYSTWHKYHAHSGIQITHGSLWKNMFFFSVPLMLSQLLQVLFNMADVAVVGKFLQCRGIGCSRLHHNSRLPVHRFSHRHWQRRPMSWSRSISEPKTKARTASSIRTSFVICLAAGCIITALCLLSARFMLELLGTKDDLIEGAVPLFPHICSRNARTGRL